MKPVTALLTSGLPLLLATLAAAAEPDLANTPFKVVPVAGSVSMLQGPGGNIGVCAGPDGVVMIDDGYAGSAAQIEKALKTVSDRPLRFVINTHIHDDHTGGNAIFQRQAPVISQTNVRARLAAGVSLPNYQVPPAAPDALPVLTFDDAVALHLNGEEIRIWHLPPAHTDGDCVVWFVHANVIHMGDLFVTYGLPYIDLDSGGHVKGMIAAIEQVLAAVPADVKVIPGHGGICTVADMTDFLARLQGTTARVEAGIAAGKTMKQLQEEKALAGFEKWGGPVAADKFIEFLYRDLTSPAQPKP